MFSAEATRRGPSPGRSSPGWPATWRAGGGGGAVGGGSPRRKPRFVFFVFLPEGLKGRQRLMRGCLVVICLVDAEAVSQPF